MGFSIWISGVSNNSFAVAIPLLLLGGCCEPGIHVESTGVSEVAQGLFEAIPARGSVPDAVCLAPIPHERAAAAVRGVPKLLEIALLDVQPVGSWCHTLDWLWQLGWVSRG